MKELVRVRIRRNPVSKPSQEEDSKEKAQTAKEIKQQSIEQLFNKDRQSAWWNEKNYERKQQ